MIDRDGRVVRWHRGAERLTGYSTSEVMGRPLAAFCRDDATEREIEERTRIARDRTAAKRRAETQRLLAEAAELLGSSLDDFAATLRAVAGLGVPAAGRLVRDRRGRP